jgi:uncharacterized repeat protein (TIGR02543 family)
MSEISQTPTPEKEEPRKLKGLYKGIDVSVTSLNVIIIVCVLVILILVGIELQNPGHTITFDPMGGTVVPAQTQMYGELLELPNPPTREGYTFNGWYKDYACFEPWNVEDDTIQSEMTLYAGWEKIT